MFGMWDVRDVGCSGGGMFGMWEVGCSGCSGCGMFRRWDVWEVGCSGCGMFEMWDVRDVGCSGCGMWDLGCLLGCGMLIYKIPCQINFLNKIFHEPLFALFEALFEHWKITNSNNWNVCYHLPCSRIPHNFFLNGLLKSICQAKQ